jgi:hypothetical protein
MKRFAAVSIFLAVLLAPLLAAADFYGKGFYADRDSPLAAGGGALLGPLAWCVITQATDDATPSVGVIGGCAADTGGNVLETSSTNTGPLAITDLDNPIAGMILFVVGTGGANPSTIADAGNFALERDWQGDADNVLVLYVQADNDYVEVARHNGPRFFDDAITMGGLIDLNGNYVTSLLGATKYNGNVVPVNIADAAGNGVFGGDNEFLGTLDVDNTLRLNLNAGAATLLFGSSFQISLDVTNDEVRYAGSGGMDWSHIFTAFAYRNTSHGLGDQGDPTIVLMDGATDPTVDNSKNFRLRWGAAGPELESGSGDFKFIGASGKGAATYLAETPPESITFDGSATNTTTTGMLPLGATIIGVSGRVTTAVTGCTTMDVGDGTSQDIFAKDVPVADTTTFTTTTAQASFANPVIDIAAPFTDGEITVTGIGGSCTGGVLALTTHYFKISAATVD